MLRVAHNIRITQVATDIYPNRNKIITFNFCNEVEVFRSFDNFTQTAKITLPRNLKYNGEDISIYQDANKEPLIQRGDIVTIECGYIGETFNPDQIFKGYISRISNDVPMILLCEDEMFILKQKTIPNYTKKNISLATLITETILEASPDTVIKIIDAEGLDVRLNESSIGNMLDVIRQAFGFYSYFVPQSNRDLPPQLKIGLPFYDPQKTETFLIEKSFIENDLQYLRSEDVKIKIKGVRIINGNIGEQPKVIELGDKDGDLRTVYQYGGTETELKRKCEQMLKDYSYTGYNGSFTTFLEPFMQPSDHCIINSYKHPERNGTYLIKTVGTSFVVNGGRQKIELERRIL